MSEIIKVQNRNLCPQKQINNVLLTIKTKRNKVITIVMNAAIIIMRNAAISIIIMISMR